MKRKPGWWKRLGLALAVFPGIPTLMFFRGMEPLGIEDTLGLILGVGGLALWGWALNGLGWT